MLTVTSLLESIQAAIKAGTAYYVVVVFTTSQIDVETDDGEYATKAVGFDLVGPLNTRPDTLPYANAIDHYRDNTPYQVHVLQGSESGQNRLMVNPSFENWEQDIAFRSNKVHA